jgi:hypothetical protein
MTATPLEAYNRLQMNIPLHRTENIDLLKNIKSTLLPLIWMQEVTLFLLPTNVCTTFNTI